MAKVDVLVPCYNYGRFLEACVGSILRQSVDDVRVLIIDDASSDNSALVAQKLAADDPRVNVRVHAQNRGHIRTYNEGIDWAESDYFLLLSADDLLVPGALDRAAKIMDANADVVLTHGDALVWQDDSALPVVREPQSDDWTRQDLVSEMCATASNPVFTPTAIGRTSIQKAIGGYHASLPHSADMDMWLRFGAHGVVAKIDAVQAIYRRHATNMSEAYYQAHEGDFWQRKATFDCFFEAYVDRIADGQRFRTRSSRTLARQAFRVGAGLIRSGVRLSDKDRIRKGYELLRTSFELDPRLRYLPPVRDLIRIPRADGRRWATSALKQAVGRLRGHAS